MPYELQLKRFERKDGQKYKIIEITDVMLHTNEHRPTNTGKAIRSSNGKPGRIYSSLEKPEGSRGDFVVELLRTDPEFVKYVQEQEALGYKVLLELPKGGIPVFSGKDTEEFIKSTKGQRVLRWIDKKNK